MMQSGSQFAEANNTSIMTQLGRGYLQLMNLQIVKLLQRVGNIYMEV